MTENTGATGAANTGGAPASTPSTFGASEGGHHFIRTDTPGVNPDANPLGEATEEKDNSLPAETDAAFWEKPKALDADGKPIEPAATETTPAEPMKEIQALMDGLDFGAGIESNEEIMEQLAKGDFTKLNEGLQAMHKQGAMENLKVTANLLQTFQTEMHQFVKDSISSAANTKESTDTMLDAFPMAKNPALRPMVEAVFTQAMERSGGDRAKATSETKAYLANMKTAMANGESLAVPAANSGAGNVELEANPDDFTGFLRS